MSSVYVKRVRRSRARVATESSSALDDDWTPPPWNEEEVRKRAKPSENNTTNDIAGIAEDITRRYYPSSGDLTWPKDFSSKAKEMRGEAKGAFRVELALYRALTTVLIDYLGNLEFKIMLFILNRTWLWKKPRDGIPTSHFLEGVFVAGKRVQAPISKSSSHFSEAVGSLEKKGLIRVTEATCKSGVVNVYEINVGRVISIADRIQRSAKKGNERV